MVNGSKGTIVRFVEQDVQHTPRACKHQQWAVQNGSRSLPVVDFNGEQAIVTPFCFSTELNSKILLC